MIGGLPETRARGIMAGMSILKIARLGRPVLRRVAEPVSDPTDAETRRLARDLVETLIDAGGAGLAAPQVHVGLRMVALRVAPDAVTEDAAPVVLVNPVVEAIGDELVPGLEGCLSIPEMRGLVASPARVRWTALDLEGRPIGGEAEGWNARVLRHETDHLDGVLYIDRLVDTRLLGFASESEHLVRAAQEWLDDAD